MTDAELAAATALLASAITGVTSLGVVAYQERRRARSAALTALGKAYIDLLARSMGVALRARAIGEIMKVRSGLGEGIDIATRVNKPIDLMGLYDWQAQDWDPLNEAWASIWTTADSEGVRLANAVVGACADLIGVSTARQPADKPVDRVRRWAVGDRWTEDMLAEHQRALETLAQARKALAEHGRQLVGVEATELFA